MLERWCASWRKGEDDWTVKCGSWEPGLMHPGPVWSVRWEWMKDYENTMKPGKINRSVHCSFSRVLGLPGETAIKTELQPREIITLCAITADSNLRWHDDAKTCRVQRGPKPNGLYYRSEVTRTISSKPREMSELILILSSQIMG